jgi:tryptophan-rich sensory protein
MIKTVLIIGGIAFLVGLPSGLTSPNDNRWFFQLSRPRWLTFEWAIPLIWMMIFICAIASAVIVWEKEPGTFYTWLRMGLFLLLEMMTMAYTSVMCKIRSLRVGVLIGGTGAILSIMLAISVFPVSIWASLCLLPYVLWSPIGTYTTWEMIHLNPGSE